MHMRRVPLSQLSAHNVAEETLNMYLFPRLIQMLLYYIPTIF